MNSPLPTLQVDGILAAAGDAQDQDQDQDQAPAKDGATADAEEEVELEEVAAADLDAAAEAEADAEETVVYSTLDDDNADQGEDGPLELQSCSSRCWVQPDDQEYMRYAASRDKLQTIMQRSDILPVTYAEWITHRLEILEDQKKELERMVRAKEMAQAEKILPALNGRTWHDGRGTVLGQETIWSHWLLPVLMPSAPWPSLQELRWEGDDRARSGVHRFLPLPREAANETVAWHQLRMVHALDFDQVRKVPTAETIQHRLAEQDHGAAWLIDCSLWEDIEA